MSADLLEAIVAGAERAARERERARRGRPLAPAAGGRTPDGASFVAALGRADLAIIAECKRRSPSRGVLCHDYDPVAIAQGYERAGAAAISVLTEPAFFDGALSHLHDVGAAVRIPILRKDFIGTGFQIDEAAAAGADAVLLIVAALDDRRLRALVEHARARGLEPLVEAHDATEVARAADAGARVIGVNSRDLRTMTVRVEVFDEIAKAWPAGTIAVAESGLRSLDQLRHLRALGFRAFLIGERFMTQPDPGAGLAAMLAGESPSQESYA